MKREFVQLAHVFKEHKQSLAGWMVSEKIDGMRAIWDGGVSKGLPIEQIPFANIEKQGRYVNQMYATGLWSRYGHPIHCPKWWSDLLPPFLIDGELYAGLKSFQFVMKTVKDLEPNDDDWRQIEYRVFDAPSPLSIFQNGVINVTNFKKEFKGVYDWYLERINGTPKSPKSFESTYNFLKDNLHQHDYLKVHEQEQLPFNSGEALDMVMNKLEIVTNDGGEGLIIRKPSSFWVPGRSHDMLKLKRLNDAEGIVTGYVWGKETDKGSKLLGLMGSLEIDFNGKILNLSGFTDGEREMVGADFDAKEIGIRNPGLRVQDDIHNPMFPRGSRVSFRYRELSNDFVPKEARYWR